MKSSDKKEPILVHIWKPGSVLALASIRGSGHVAVQIGYTGAYKRYFSFYPGKGYSEGGAKLPAIRSKGSLRTSLFDDCMLGIDASKERRALYYSEFAKAMVHDQNQRSSKEELQRILSSIERKFKDERRACEWFRSLSPSQVLLYGDGRKLPEDPHEYLVTALKCLVKSARDYRERDYTLGLRSLLGILSRFFRLEARRILDLMVFVAHQMTCKDENGYVCYRLKTLNNDAIERKMSELWNMAHAEKGLTYSVFGGVTSSPSSFHCVAASLHLLIAGGLKELEGLGKIGEHKEKVVKRSILGAAIAVTAGGLFCLATGGVGGVVLVGALATTAGAGAAGGALATSLSTDLTVGPDMVKSPAVMIRLMEHARASRQEREATCAPPDCDSEVMQAVELAKAIR